MPHEMPAPAKAIEDFLKAKWNILVKTPFIYPTGIALSALVYLLVLLYINQLCFSSMLAPLVLLGFFWKAGVKGSKKLIVLGLIATLVFFGILLAFSTNQYETLEIKDASSEKHDLSNGTVTPRYSEGTGPYNYTIIVNLADANTTVQHVYVNILSGVYPTTLRNETMSLAYRNNDTLIAEYYYETTLSSAINLFAFAGQFNNSWYLAADFNELGQPRWVPGPVQTNAFAVAGELVLYTFMTVFLGVFVVYFIIVGMIWWTRRARKMRENQLAKWEREREDELAAAGKDSKAGDSKKTSTPRLSKAMGTEADDSFVCSECGADVPADAKVCPKCGEKFE